MMEDIDGELIRTTIYEPQSFVPLARIEMRPGEQGQEAEQADAQAMLSQLKHTLLGAGLALPKQLTEAIDAQGAPAPRIGWFHTDHLGTPLALSDDNGQLLWYAQPDDWGAVQAAHGSVTQPIRFQGQYHDAESGLFYNRHRYYDPGMGRYVSQDPIGLAGGVNFYGYVEGNPARFIDPRGLEVGGYLSLRSCGEGVWNEAGRRIKELFSPITDYCKPAVDRLKEGVTGEATVGGMAVALLGVKQTVGAAIAGDGQMCVTNATCLVVGPMVGGYTTAGGSFSTGAMTPGSAIWQLGIATSGVLGAGYDLGGLVGSDGSIEGGGDGALGGAIGGALLICKKRTTNACKKK